MPSPLSAFFDAARTSLEAVTPHVDGSGLAYRRIGTPGKQGGATQHRLFTWLPSLSQRWVRGAGAGLPIIEFRPRLALYVLQSNKTDDAYALDLIEENATIWRWFLAQHESGFAINGIEHARMGEDSIFEPTKQRLLFSWTVRSQEYAT